MKNKSIFQARSQTYREPLETYLCPHCNNSFTLSEKNSLWLYVDQGLNFFHYSVDSGVIFDLGNEFRIPAPGNEERTAAMSGLDLLTLKCPNMSCKQFVLFINSYGPEFPNFYGQVLPAKSVTYIPKCVPKHIQEDINEAELIVDLSPKASATLSRRALQSMIRDFHGIKERNLHEEIKKLIGLVSTNEYDVLMSIKSLGNHGAHANTSDLTNQIIEIEENEANDLILIILHFVKSWYVKREETEQLINRITSVAASK